MERKLLVSLLVIVALLLYGGSGFAQLSEGTLSSDISLQVKAVNDSFVTYGGMSVKAAEITDVQAGGVTRRNLYSVLKVTGLRSTSPTGVVNSAWVKVDRVSGTTAVSAMINSIRVFVDNSTSRVGVFERYGTRSDTEIGTLGPPTTNTSAASAEWQIPITAGAINTAKTYFIVIETGTLAAGDKFAVSSSFDKWVATPTGTTLHTDVVSSGTITADVTKPILSAFETVDPDKDGFIGAIAMRFSEPVVDTTFNLVSRSLFSTIDVDGFDGERRYQLGLLPNYPDNLNDSTVFVSFTETETDLNTDLTPNVASQFANQLSDLAGNLVVADVNQLSVDKAPPRIWMAATQDTNKNGKVDRLVMYTSESFLPKTYPSYDGFGYFDKVTFAPADSEYKFNKVRGYDSLIAVNPALYNLDNDPVHITGAAYLISVDENLTNWRPKRAAFDGYDGGIVGNFIYDDAEGSVTDIASNKLQNDRNVIVVDRAAPVIINAITRDKANRVGELDMYVVNLSENVTGTPGLRITTLYSSTGASVKGDSIEFVVSERGGELRTGEKPDLFVDSPNSSRDGAKNRNGSSYKPDGTNGNALTTGAGWTLGTGNAISAIIDGIPPRIKLVDTKDSDRDGKIDGLRVEFSEPMMDSSSTRDWVTGVTISYSGPKSAQFTQTITRPSFYVVKGSDATGVSYSIDEPNQRNSTDLSYNTDIIPDFVYDRALGKIRDYNNQGNTYPWGRLIDVQASPMWAANPTAEELRESAKILELDGAAPVVVNAVTGDTRALRNSMTQEVGNGIIDYYLLTFSEEISLHDKSFAGWNTNFRIYKKGTTESIANEIQIVVANTKKVSSIDDQDGSKLAVLQLVLDEKNANLAFGTDVTPEIRYLSLTDGDYSEAKAVEDSAGIVYSSVNRDQHNVPLMAYNTTSINANSGIIDNIVELDGAPPVMLGYHEGYLNFKRYVDGRVNYLYNADGSTNENTNTTSNDQMYLASVSGSYFENASIVSWIGTTEQLTNAIETIDYGRLSIQCPTFKPDSNGDGYIDAFKIYLSEKVSIPSNNISGLFPDVQAGLNKLDNFTIREINNVANPPYVIIQDLNPDMNAPNTDATPYIVYQQSSNVSVGIFDQSTLKNAMLSSTRNPSIDKAPAIIVKAVAKVTDNRLALDFSEPSFHLKPMQYGNLSDIVAPHVDFEYVNNRDNAASDATKDKVTDLVQGATTSELNGSDGKVTLTVNGNFTLQDITLDGLKTRADAIFDSAGNASKVVCVIFDDKIGPYVLAATTCDLDGNGWIDHIRFVLSEDVDDATVDGYKANAIGTSASSGWDVVGYTGEKFNFFTSALSARTAGYPSQFSPADNRASDNILYLMVDEKSGGTNKNTKVGDTDARPIFAHPSSPSVKDFQPNAYEVNLENQTGAAANGTAWDKIKPYGIGYQGKADSLYARDAAGPVIMQATTVELGHLAVVMSEDITGLDENLIFTDTMGTALTAPANDANTRFAIGLQTPGSNLQNISVAAFEKNRITDLEEPGVVHIYFGGFTGGKSDWFPENQGIIRFRGVGALTDASPYRNKNVLGNSAPETRWNITNNIITNRNFTDYVRLDNGVASKLDITVQGIPVVGMPLDITVKALTNNNLLAYNFGPRSNSRITFGVTVGQARTPQGAQVLGDGDPVYGGQGSFKITPQATGKLIIGAYSDYSNTIGVFDTVVVNVIEPVIKSVSSIKAMDAPDDQGYVVRVIAGLSPNDPASKSFNADSVGENTITKYQVYRVSGKLNDTLELDAEVPQAASATRILIDLYAPSMDTVKYAVSAVSGKKASEQQLVALGKFVKGTGVNEGKRYFNQIGNPLAKVGDILVLSGEYELTEFSSIPVISEAIAPIDNVSPKSWNAKGTAEWLTGGTVKVSWELSSEDAVVATIDAIPIMGVSQYQIYRRTLKDGNQQDAFTLIGTVENGVKTFIDKDQTLNLNQKYEYDVRAIDGNIDNPGASGGVFKLEPTAVDGSEEITEAIPKVYNLYQNYPNPFNPTTTVKFDLPKDGFVKIFIYNVLGQRVRTLVNETMSAGVKRIVWDGRNDSGIMVTSGLYIYQINAGNYSNTRKMIFMK